MPMSTSSFSASLVRSRSEARPILNLWEPARVTPCCFIWARLNSSDRSGGSLSPYVFPGPLLRRLALKCRKFPITVRLAFKLIPPIWQQTLKIADRNQRRSLGSLPERIDPLDPKTFDAVFALPGHSNCCLRCFVFQSRCLPQESDSTFQNEVEEAKKRPGLNPCRYDAFQ